MSDDPPDEKCSHFTDVVGVYVCGHRKGHHSPPQEGGEDTIDPRTRRPGVGDG